VELRVINHTRYVHGGHATTMLVNDFVNARLGNYGPGVEMINVTLLYPPRSRPGRSPGGFGNFWNMVSRSPQATFFRAKQRIDVRCVCPDVSVRSIEAVGHLTQDEAGKIVTAVLSALELIRTKMRPTDRFDYDSFFWDAKRALLELPGAIQQYLKPI
jgi:hypothetical protein